MAQIDKQIDPLCRGEVRLLAFDRCRKQTAVVADQRERERRACRGTKRQRQRTRIGRVEYPEAIDARRQVEIGTVRAVDEEFIAQPAVHQVLRRGRIVRAGTPILQHQRNLGDSRCEVERRAQRAFVVILDQDEAEQAAIGLRCGQAVRMRVIPVHSAAVANREIVFIARTRGDQDRTVAVVARIDREPVPVDDRRLREQVDERDAGPFAVLQDQRRIRVAPSAVARGKTLRSRRKGRRYAAGRTGCQRQEFAARCQAAQVARVSRNEEAARTPVAGATEGIDDAQRRQGVRMSRAGGGRQAQCGKAMQQAATGERCG